VDELELLERARPEAAPAPEIVARHRLALAEAMEPGMDDPYEAAGQPQRQALIAALATAAVVLAGVAAVMLSDDVERTTRVVTAPAAQATTTTAPGTIVPCGSGLPVAIPEGRYEHAGHDSDPESISVRLYACRIERSLPETMTGPDGRTEEMVTTLRELTERFGGLEGSVFDEFGRAHPISLAPLAGADPDTTAVGLVWMARPRNAPAPLPGLPQPPPQPQTLDPPWLGRPRN
jgi:hypothetical protein